MSKGVIDMLVRTGAARRGLLMLVGCVLAIAGAATRAHSGSAAPSRPTAAAKTCPPGYVDALLSWGEKCLHGGQFCKVRNPEYHAYGFDCPTDGHLVELAQPTTTTTTTTATAPAAVPLGRTVRLAARRRADGCKRGALPDRRCSPGAIYGGLTKTVICSASFRTSSVRNVPQSEKYTVEREYGMAARSYGRTIEIDHIVSLELGGSNDVANLFPEPGSGAANYHVKDRLENRLHDMVCAGRLTLASAQRNIAADWEKLYTRVFGVAPTEG